MAYRLVLSVFLCEPKMNSFRKSPFVVPTMPRCRVARAFCVCALWMTTHSSFVEMVIMMATGTSRRARGFRYDFVQLLFYGLFLLASVI